MTVETKAADKLRHFGRVYKLTLYRTSTPLFDEQFSVNQTDSGIEITDLRMEFEVERNLTKHPNSCSITVTNLNKAARTALSKKPLKVVLEAGYDGVARLLYSGDMVFGMSTLKGPDWSTLIQCGDGDRISASARINRSYPGGTAVKSVLKDLAESMGQKLPANVLRDRNLDSELQGYAAFGSTSDQLTRVLLPFDYTWSIQNGQLQILKISETAGDYLIDETASIIGSPEFGSPPRSGKPPHVTVKMLLYPELRPGGRAKVKTAALNGTYKIHNVKHSGDTHGEHWTTSAELKPL